MMNNGSFGQFQRGNSCSQGRGTASCAQPQQRPTGTCNQPQQRPAGTCSQPQQRPSAPCNQAPPCPPPTCNQSMHPTPPCNHPERPSRPARPCDEMNREQLLNWISMTKFACVDATLYLDTHPDDLEAIRYFQEHIRLYNEAVKEYAKKYGPLTIAHAHHCDTYWDWVNQPWPWQ